MFPPDRPPPGVFASPDGLEVAQPVSLMEWFFAYYDQARSMCPVQFIAHPGDLVFVPSQWWHCVLNLEFAVAVTQNYIAESNLAKALDMMKRRPHLVSGIPASRDKERLYDEFVEALTKSQHGGIQELLKETLTNLQREKKVRAATPVRKHLQWKRMKSSEDATPGAFKFAFF